MGVVNQEACFTCPYRNASAADIRLGDYWGERFRENEQGVSMVLINTLKGDEFFSSIRDKIYCEEHNIVGRMGLQHEDYQRPQYYDKSM